MTTFSNETSGTTGTAHGLPGMPRGGVNGKRPERVRITIDDDASGSGSPWARSIEAITEHLVNELDNRFLSVTYDYVGMRDMDIGEADEYRLRGGSGADLLREQKLLRRFGGGDAEETFFQTAENHLSDPNWMPYTGASEALGMVMFTTSSSKPAKLNSVEALAEELKNRRIKLFVIGEPGSNMEALVNASEGFFFPLRVDPTPTEAQEIATKLAATVKTTMGKMVTTRREDGTAFDDPVAPVTATLRRPIATMAASAGTVARP